MDQATFLTCVGNAISSEAAVATSYAAAGFDGLATSYLTTSSVAAVSFAGTDKYIIGGWIKPTAVDAEYYFFELSTTADEVIAALAITNTGAFKGEVEGEVKSGPAIAAGVKQFFLFYYDPAADTFSLSLDGGADATSGVIVPSIAVERLTIGASLANEVGFLGALDEVFICKNPADLAAAVTFAKTTIYNSGTGIHYSALSAGNKTTLGLVAWWQFDEASGTREDAEGSTDLTPAGGVTATTALVS